MFIISMTMAATIVMDTMMMMVMMTMMLLLLLMMMIVVHQIIDRAGPSAGMVMILKLDAILLQNGFRYLWFQMHFRLSDLIIQNDWSDLLRYYSASNGKIWDCNNNRRKHTILVWFCFHFALSHPQESDPRAGCGGLIWKKMGRRDGSYTGTPRRHVLSLQAKVYIFCVCLVTVCDNFGVYHYYRHVTHCFIDGTLVLIRAGRIMAPPGDMILISPWSPWVLKLILMYHERYKYKAMSRYKRLKWTDVRSL